MGEPYISRQSVSRQLDRLVYDAQSDPPNTELAGLMVIDLFVRELPAADVRLDYAIRDLLTRLVIEAYGGARRALDLPPPDLHLPLSAAQAALHADAKPRNPNLLAWSLLYHRYVRADLDLTAQQLAAVISVNERTFRRYQAYAVRLLTYRLIALEHRARLDAKQRHLLTLLPSRARTPLIGREPLLDSAVNHLLTIATAHLLVTGMAGIGKTAFAQEVARRLIEADGVDDVLWFDQPLSAQLVIDHVRLRLLGEDARIDLAEALLVRRVLIVLDGITALVGELDRVVDTLGAAALLLTHVEYVSGVSVHIALRDLSPDDSAALAHELLRKRHAEGEADELANIAYARFGGNPGVICALLHLWDYEDVERLEARLYEQTFGRAFEDLPISSRMAWCAFAAAALSLTDVVGVAGITPDDVSLLLRRHLLEREPDGRCALINGARAYLLARQTPLVESALTTVIEALDGAPASYALAYALLASPLKPTALDAQSRLIHAYLPRAASAHSADWRAIIEEYVRLGGILSLDARLLYGVLLRRLQVWDSAGAVFMDVVAATGRRGDFRLQADALLEWSLALKYQGDYGRAQQLITQAQRLTLRLITRLSDDGLRERLALQAAQLLVETEKPSEALALLTGLPLTPRLLTVQSEALLALDDFFASRRAAELALQVPDLDPGTQASLYTVIARSYEDEGALDAAEPFFARTVMLLEQVGDAYRLARAQSNLAALLIKRQGYADARTLLNRAESTQVRVRDQVGLMATRHNRTILHRHLAR